MPRKGGGGQQYFVEIGDSGSFIEQGFHKKLRNRVSNKRFVQRFLVFSFKSKDQISFSKQIFRDHFSVEACNVNRK